MSLNLIETLLLEQPEIDERFNIIKSDIPLSNLFMNLDKSELVSLAAYLDEEWQDKYTRGYLSNLEYKPHKYSLKWEQLGLPKMYISRRLLEFLKTQQVFSIIKTIFRLDIDSFGLTNSKKIFEYILAFNHLKEGNEGYLIYGNGSQIRFGKFINSLINILYRNDMINGYYHCNSDLEHFVDVYKVQFSRGSYTVCVLNGDDIKIGYDTDYQQQRHSSMLTQSCMNNKLNYLKIYTKNPKVISLFVILDERGKIVARSLVWKIKSLNNYLMDRVYCVDNHIGKMALDLAEQENWMTHNTLGSKKYKRITIDGEIQETNIKRLSVKLKFRRGILTYPYLDTFKYSRLGSNKVSNKPFSYLYNSYNCTSGGHSLYLFG